ncbi:uncharacterized protein LOC132205783 [Neocloeon triangulifer]|uniref:uncharacterized protein LOC132205783 n=1 Tax=Neocloeon triangulifer TaxID=2078957 RepID=UPI00286ED01F|nr:uncharacterized protein LOC132205783 [Neocloeon triangulifer]
MSYRGQDFIHPRRSRKRYSFCDALEDTALDIRHSRGKWLKDEHIKQVSRHEWHVLSATNHQTVYTVKRLIEDDDDQIEEHNYRCEYWGHEDTFYANEGYCRSCEICCHFYECDCPDEHPICKHIHKVHMFNNKAVKEQQPHDLQKTIETALNDLKTLRSSIRLTDEGDFCVELQAFNQMILDKYFAQ